MEIKKTMKTLIIFMAMLIMGSYTAHSQSVTETYSGVLKITVDELPRYEDYPTSSSKNLKVVKNIDWNSHEDAELFRTRLTKALQEGPNFAGHYTVAYFGCGSSCQTNFVIDVTNGKIVASFVTSAGSFFKQDSNLLIANLPETPNDFTVPLGTQPQTIEFYEMKNGVLSRFRTVDLKGLHFRGDRGQLQ